MKVKFGVCSGPASSLEESIQNIQHLENSGFDSIWMDDHLINLRRRNRCLDPWPIMAALAPHTHNVTFGSMVTDPFRRHPAILAQTLATIDWIMGGRLILGIGAGEAMNVAPFNILWDHRARRLAESVRVMRNLWTGDAIDFSGEFFKLDKAFIQAIPQKKLIPIYIAANSPFTRKIAGQLGEGWISEMLSPNLYKKDLEEVKKAATEAGRTIKDIDVVYHVFSAISKDTEEAKDYANKMVKMQFTWWPKHLERYGCKISDRCDWNQIVVNENSYAESKELSKEVPEKIADSVTISGNTDECIDKIEKYVEVGVTHFAFIISGLRDETLKALGGKIIPYFRELH